MSCLLPQFKCQPDTFSIHFRTQFHPTQLAKNRLPICFQTQCILSTTAPSTSTSTAVLDLDKLRLTSLEGQSNPVVANRPYTETLDPPKEASREATLARETLITSDEALIAAAAAEAVTLARAAVKVAKDVAMMANNLHPVKTENKTLTSFATGASLSMWSQLTDTERADIIGDTDVVETREMEESFGLHHTNDSDFLDPTREELALLERQISEGVAVRSRRQKERKNRRARAAEKAASTVVSVKSGSMRKKKRGSTQDFDFNDPLRYLRGTASSSKLLSATEELELSVGIQDLLKLEQIWEELAERSGDQPTFTQWAAAAGVDQGNLRRRLTHGAFCKNKMIKSNIRLVIAIAKNYVGVGMDFEDLVQEGCRGLIRGAEKFDATKGFKFSTYAHWWIKQAVRKSLSDQSRIIRIPVNMVEATYRMRETRKQLLSENGRQPDDEEVAEASGLSPKRLNAILLTPKPPRSLDQKIGIMDVKPSEFISDPKAMTTEELLMKQFMKEDLKKVLDGLTPKETRVIKLRYGFVDGETKTLQQIGESMGVSRERIRQIEKSAFRKLKNKKRTNHLNQYVVP